LTDVATITIDNSRTSKTLIGYGSTWSVARAGTSVTSISAPQLASYLAPGSGGLYNALQVGLLFDLSGIPSDVVLIGATLKLKFYGAGAAGCTLQCRLYDWGASYNTSDFIPGANQSAYYQLLAYLSTADIVDGSYVSMTNESTNLLDLIKTQADRDYLSGFLKVMIADDKQSGGSAPTLSAPWTLYNGTYPYYHTSAQLEVTYATTSQIITTAHVSAHALMGSGFITTEAAASTHARCRVRVRRTPESIALQQETANRLKLYDKDRVYLGPLAATDVEAVEDLDKAWTLRFTPPLRFTRIDGTQDDRFDMITGGWYAEYRGNWYLLETYNPALYENKVPVIGISAETELDRFFTNYSSVPFSMPSHTPTEIMRAVLSGQVEADWYNGDFSELDSAGFPVGWTDNSGNWQAITTGVRAIEANSFDDGEAELESFGINHTAGAEIKPIVEVWAEPGFVGTIKLVLSWTNTSGSSSATNTYYLPYSTGAWTKFEAPDWVSVLNEKCVCKLQVEGNTGGYGVRFRGVRFRQNAPDTEWTYRGSLDSRDPAIAYNDPAIQLYGTWTHDHINETVYSETVGDVLGRVFTGDKIAVNFAAGGAGAQADILVDGEVQSTRWDVSGAGTYTVSNLDKYHSHVLEVIVKAVKVSISGLEVSSENRIAVTWSRLSAYEALSALREIVGGEYAFDTAARVISHDEMQGDDLTALNMVWLREGVNLNLDPEVQISSVRNEIHYAGHGDGAFQLSLTMKSTATDAEGNTSEDLYGTQRFVSVNKDTKDMASAIAEAARLVEENPFPLISYSGDCSVGDGECIQVGDTVRMTSEVLGTDSVRVLQITRRSGSRRVGLTLGQRVTITDHTAVLEAVRQQVAQLLRKF